LISAANITMQFGGKPLFENVSVKFGGGNRYGLIGANGCGKFTLLKILGAESVAQRGQRVGEARQTPRQTAPGPVIRAYHDLNRVR